MSPTRTQPAPPPEHGAQAASKPADIARSVLRAEAQAVLNVIDRLDGGFDRAAGLVAGCSGTVIVSGMGKSGIVARKISATLASTGTPSHYLHPTEALHGDLGRVRRGDLVVLLSYSGETEDVLALAALLRQDGVPMIALTGRADSHLARLADARLCVGDVAEACPLNLAPTASTTAMLALGDALALAVSGGRNFTADDFRKRHPGGLLGRQTMSVLDAARFRVDRGNLPLVADGGTIAGTLTEAARSPRRPGAVLLVDHTGRLSGIFTDADLRRVLIERGPDAPYQSVADMMTRSPRRLTADALVRDAVQLVREHRLDELPIVDASDRPLALIDVQDLIALKVIEE